MRSDRKRYEELLGKVGSMVKGIDFNQNLLFISRENIAKEVFLSGFSKLSDIHSYYYCNLLDLHDIWWGNRRKDNVNIPEEDIMYAESDIRQDVLCVFSDIEMYSMGTDKVLNSIITTRNDKQNSKGFTQRTWVFFRGSMSDLRDTKGFKEIYKIFHSHIEEGYQIIDLNNTGVHITSEISNSKKSSTGKVPNTLSDVY